MPGKRVDRLRELSGGILDLPPNRAASGSTLPLLTTEETRARRAALSGRVGELADDLTLLYAQLASQSEEIRGLRALSESRNNRLAQLDEQMKHRDALLQIRDAEVQKLTEELATLRRTCNEALAELSVTRRQREALEDRLRDVESASASGAAPIGYRSATPASTPPAELPAALAEQSTVIHFEDDQGVRNVLQVNVGRFPHTAYLSAEEAQTNRPSGERVLVVNLLGKCIDPFRSAADALSWGLAEPHALAYCAAGTRGLILGLVDFFPHPFDPHACATRLLSRTPNGIQHFLAVSEDVSTMGELRTILGRLRCSTAVAIDGRQAIELLPIVKPQAVLVDMSLPKDAGLKVIMHLRNDPRWSGITVGIWWGRPPIRLPEFAEGASRVARDTPFTASALAAVLTQRLRLHLKPEPLDSSRRPDRGAAAPRKRMMEDLVGPPGQLLPLKRKSA